MSNAPRTPVSVPLALLREAVDRFGTPAYVYDLAVLRDRCDLLSGALAPLGARLLYAMKANSNPELLRTILEAGLRLEAVSPAEVILALRLGATAGDVLFSANNMTDEEMTGVAELGVLFNIGELSRLERFGRVFPGRRVVVRLNPNLGAGHHRHVVTAGKETKFGVPLDQISEILRVAAKHRLQVIGLHQHIGSGIADTRQLREAMAVLLDAAHHFEDLQFLDFGGGLNVPYRPEDRPFDLENFRANVVDPLLDFETRTGRSLAYWFEPGRFLVAECGALVVRVNTLKESGGRIFAGTDSGFNHLIRPVLYGAYHRITNLSNPGGPRRTYDIVGNICESGDVFASNRPVEEIREGDALAILDAGAYGMAMASRYNLRELPAEILITPERTLRLIRPPLSAASLVDRYLAEYRIPPFPVKS